MIGNFPPLPGLDPGEGAAGRRSGAAPMPGVRTAAGATASGAGAGAPAPRIEAERAGVVAETARLKALLTDPGMRVSTHRDESSGRAVMRVEDRATGELIEQIPSEELLRLYAGVRESLLDERA